MAVAGLAGCTRGGDGDRVQASISVSPLAALVDQPVAVTVQGLPEEARTTLTARARDTEGSRGRPRPSSRRPRPGGVTGPAVAGRQLHRGQPHGAVHAHGPTRWLGATTFLYADAGYDVTLQASVGDRVVATATVRRQDPDAVGVVEKKLRPTKGGIYGNLYLLKNTAARRPGVLVFGGSGGGLTTGTAAALLAAHGYPSLALAYFKAPGLPQTLQNIPLEYFTKALGVLRAQPGVDPRRVLVAGSSRGGEAALLLGAHFPQVVNGVIAGVPSSVVNPGLPDDSKPAWTVRGRPLPAVSTAEFGRPNPPGKPQAVIPVERIRGPVLLACGGQDLIWPSCGYVDAITARLRSHRFSHPVTALLYPDAGHLIGGLTAWLGSLTDGALTSSGGTVAATQAAQAAAHAKLLALLAAP